MSAKWVWNEKRETAARLAAADELNDEEIAAQAGITPRQLTRWKAIPEFQARIEEHVEACQAASLKHAIADKNKRVGRLNEAWEALQAVIKERAEEYDGQHPGSGTGLLVVALKGVGAGPRARVVEEWSVDTGLLAELRLLEQQAAKELGQWADRAPVDENGRTVRADPDWTRIMADALRLSGDDSA